MKLYSSIKMYSKSSYHIAVFMSFAALQLAWSIDNQVRALSSKPMLTIVHMGESFSSGAGARDALGDAKWIGPSSCYRSPYGWGQQFADAMGDAYLVNYTNVACGGATLSAIQRVTRRRFESKPIPAQIDSIHNNVDYVVMSFGANDLGYRDLILGCYMKGLRDVFTCRQQINKFRSGYGAFQTDMTKELLFMEQSLNPDNTNPDAKVVIVSYPHTITRQTYYLRDKFSNDTIDISTEIRKLFVEGDAVLRNLIRNVNELVGRDYVVLFNHTKDLFNGHEPDPSYEIENPLGWFWEFDVDDIRETYHLNREGHRQLGKAMTLFFQDELLAPVLPNDVRVVPPCTNFFWCPMWGSLFQIFSASPSSFWS